MIHPELTSPFNYTLNNLFKNSSVCLLVNMGSEEERNIIYEPELPFEQWGLSRLILSNKKKLQNIIFNTSYEIYDLDFYSTNKKSSKIYPFTESMLRMAENNNICAGLYQLTPQEYFKNNSIIKKIHYNSTIDEYFNSDRTSLDKPVTGKKKLFISLNSTPREHRIELMNFLVENGLDTLGYCSFSLSKSNEFSKSLYSTNNFIMSNSIEELEEKFWKIGKREIDVGELTLSVFERSAKQNKLPKEIWEDTYFSIISETCYHDKEFTFITEKTWKVFDNFHLPIWLSAPGTAKLCSNKGFDIFSDIIDHSYDSITNNKKRMFAVFKEIERLATLDWEHIYPALHFRLELNKKRLAKLHKEQQYRIMHLL